MTTLWAWVTVMPDGRESLIGLMVDGHHTPLVTVNFDIAIRTEPLARRHCEALGQPCRLVEFREVEREP